MTDHPRIYLQPECCATDSDVGRLWCEDDEPVECGCPDGPCPWVAYVRADLPPTDERDREIFHAGWKHGERVGRGAGPTDDELRELVKSIAQATVELVVEGLPGPAAESLWRVRARLADGIATATMADADPEAPVNALRGRI